MYKFLLVSLFTILFCNLKSQQNYYAYLQTQNQAPFYIKYNAKLISSSLNGFLILPKLTNGEHIIKIGFPKSAAEEILFPIAINGKDEGFTIQVNDGAITAMKQMFSDVAVAPLNKNATIAKVETKTTEIPKVVDNSIATKPSTSTTTSSTVVNETELKQNKTEVVENKLPDPIKTIDPVIVAKQDLPNVITPKASNETEIKVNKTDNPINKNATFAVNRTSVTPQNNTIEATYIVKEENGYDTITVQIPYVKENNKTVVEPEVIKEITPEQIEPKSVNGEDKATIIPDAQNKEVVILENTDCVSKQKVTDEKCKDIRVKMAKKSSATDMNKIAIAAFKKSCFTAAQIKYLGVLFDDDFDKLAFYKLAYPFVNDADNFKKLFTEFKTEEAKGYFNSLFKK